MFEKLLPDWTAGSVLDISPEVLAGHGMRLALLDLDNTLAPYGADAPARGVVTWCDRLRAAGVRPFLLTNCREHGRTEAFGILLGAGWICHARKPRAAGYLAAMKQAGASPCECVMVGDQVFTDVLGARRAGARAILVEPMDLSYRALHRFRYLLEVPFRDARRDRPFP